MSNAASQREFDCMIAFCVGIDTLWALRPLTITELATGIIMAAYSDAIIEIRPHPSCLIIKIFESQMRDFAKVIQIKEAIITAVREMLPKTVIIDLSRLQFVGSVGFLAFLAIRREPTVENIVLCNLDANVHQVFSVCRLIPEGADAAAPLQLADTVDAAIAMYDGKTDASKGQ